ncbi:glycine betaine ABC transporter substrate-binding protein [Virgibacillus sp. YIM 98842]|uniref:glycine betaine ABC transporter substrate-binding protein n=1 Tax=Virgibacillus sp. YIM 98842 TaxID=2663533 RepID=UPI001F09F91B|nr:glycine betaine ABC transporter substrate-binding protein [Virgibacillus sp. YIM 98842]
MKKVLVMITVLLLSIGLYGCGAAEEEEGNEAENEENQELVMGLTTWTSTIPPTEIVIDILEDMGYSIEVEEADIGVIYAGLANGEIDIYMDSWYPQQTQYLEEYSDTIEQLAPIYEDANAGMVVPEYMEDINDVADLIGKEEIVNNELIAIEDGDPAMDELQELIDAYELDVELISSSEGAMLAAAKAGTDDNEPILLYGWEPHSMFNDMDLKILTNEEHPEFFNGSSVHPVVNKDVKEKAPEAYELLEDWTVSIADMEEMITKVDNGEDAEEIAQQWLDNNPEWLNNN